MKNTPLENKILKFIEKSEILLCIDPELGSRFINQAIRLYDKISDDGKTYTPEIEHALNPICCAYIDYLLEKQVS